MIAATAVMAACVSPREFTPAAPTVPQPRLPRNDVYQGSVITGSLRPRFVWEPSTAQRDPIVYELQYSPDPKLETDVTTVKTSELTYQPPEPLAVSTVPPVGRRYYWRVRACLEESCSEYSRPWWVNLGRSAKDLNGDGYADVVGVSTANEVFVFFGGSGSRFDAIPEARFKNADAPGFGASPSQGDFNGDGFADLAVGARNRLFVYFGQAGASFDSSADVTIAGPMEGDFGSSLSFVGDLNGDGLQDLAVGDPSNSVNAPFAGRVSVYWGSATAEREQLGGVITGTKELDQLVLFPPAGVDVNGDGFSELILTIGRQPDEFQPGPCIVQGFQGAPGTRFDPAPDLTYSYTGGVCGLLAGAGGDFNGDGFGDIPAAASPFLMPCELHVYAGGPAGVAEPKRRVLSDNTYCRAVSSLGDIDNDGVDDLVIISDAARASIYYGSRESLFVDTPIVAQTANRSLQRAGDTNGDGFDDVLERALDAYRVYFGGPRPLDLVSDVTLPTPRP